MTSRLLLKRVWSTPRPEIPTWVVGAIVASPMVVGLAASIQGVTMLSEYRKKHLHAPRPISPTRGVVMVKDRRISKGAFHHHDGGVNSATSSSSRKDPQGQRPIRLLVIGDSLAAGVGISTQGTPVLPESIARALSKALGGRAVYWTCHGTPGAGAAQIVEEIEFLNGQRDTLDSDSKKVRMILQIQKAVHRAIDVFSINKNDDEETKSIDDNEMEKHLLQRWKQKLKNLREGADEWIFKLKKRIEDDQEDFTPSWKHWKAKLTHDKDGEEKYDVAIVLTGLNDLKSLVLPYLGDKSMPENGAGMKAELVRLLRALKVKKPQRDEIDGEPGPLVVFPGIPHMPTPLFRIRPLSWFAQFVVSLNDETKRELQAEFPGSVLYVEPPTTRDICDFESGTGPLCENRRAEKVLLKITSATKRAKEKVEALMREHYGAEEAEEEETEPDHDSQKSATMYDPGTRMVSKDHIHPNEEGYDFWGRHIAATILKEWKVPAASITID